MADLIGFLNARLDEDEHYLHTMIDVGEQAAAAQTPADVADVYAVAMTVLSDPRARQIVEQRMGSPIPVPNDLKRLLREVEAKRAIVRLHGPMSISAGHPMFNDAHLTRAPMRLCRSCEPETMWRRERSWPCRTLLTLAAVYSDHPDYRQEWAP